MTDAERKQLKRLKHSVIGENPKLFGLSTSTIRYMVELGGVSRAAFYRFGGDTAAKPTATTWTLLVLHLNIASVNR